MTSAALASTGARPSASAAGAVASAFAGTGPVGPVGVALAALSSPASVPAPDVAQARAQVRLLPAASDPIVRTVQEVIHAVPPLMWLLVSTLAGTSVLLAAASWLLAGHRRRLEREHLELIEDVGMLQRALLPGPPGQLAGVGSSVATHPAPGGDSGATFHDVFALGRDRLGVVVGDLPGESGHALGLGALARNTLRAYLEAGTPPRVALKLASHALAPQLADASVAATVAVYCRDEGHLVLAAAGHPPPVVLGPPGFAPVTAVASPPLGVTGSGRRQTELALPPGALVCLCTRSLLDHQPRAARFDYRRLALAVSALGGRASARAVIDEVVAEAGEPRAAAAACVLRIAHHVDAPAPVVGVRRIEELELSPADLADGRVEGFLTECGVPGSRVEQVLGELRGSGPADAVLRVRMGPGVPRVEVATPPRPLPVRAAA